MSSTLASADSSESDALAEANTKHTTRLPRVSDESSALRDDDSGTPPASAGQTTAILVASVVSAAASLIITVLTARVLSVDDNAEFLVFWSLYFGIVGIIAGVQTESTRAVTASQLSTDRGAGARVQTAALILGLSVGAIIAATSPLWLGVFLHRSSPWVVLAVVAGVVLSAGHFTTLGALSGQKSWYTFAWLIGVEAIVRPIGALVAGLVLARALLPVQISVVLPAAVWILFCLFTTSGRGSFAARADVPLGKLLRNNIMTMLSSASWALLVTGFPALLRATGGDVDSGVLAGTILAITLTRAPIMIPLQAVQGVAINKFTHDQGRNLKVIFTFMAGVLGIGVIGGILAGLIGPWIIRAIYGSAYQVAPFTVGALTVAAAGMGWLVLTGAATLGISAHRAYTGGWFIAAVCAFGIAALPLDLVTRAILALGIGPLPGVAVHVITLVRHRRRLSSGQPATDLG
ncbi:hypothetical protein HMPREF1531_00849 [Propionibacterium sp. oral taxon 192 str. F0372]|nr:hypothetical protein HMPREF1531_00849 [Propionibacterium sp. oral taxon 192 str. F0372]